MRHFIRLAQLAAWALIAIIAYFTLTRVGVVYSIYYKLSPLLMWPEMKTYARFEHVIAFALFGVICCVAYPRRIFLVCGMVFGTAITLELLQTLTPDRHGTLVDALEKLAGGACGILIAKGVIAIRRRRRACQTGV
jgi:VanZ family protein